MSAEPPPSLPPSLLLVLLPSYVYMGWSSIGGEVTNTQFENFNHPNKYIHYH